MVSIQYTYSSFTVAADSFIRLVRQLDQAYWNKSKQRVKNKQTTTFDGKFAFNEVETDQVYITEKELNDLYKFDFSHNKKLEQVRDLFIFGAWVGLRFSDFSNIKSENIVKIEGDHFIKMITKKQRRK